MRNCLKLVCASVLLLGATQVFAATDPVSAVATTSLPASGHLHQDYPIAYTFTNDTDSTISGFEVGVSGANGTLVETSGCAATLASGATCNWAGTFTPTGSTTKHTAIASLKYWGIEVPVKQSITASEAITYVTVGYLGATPDSDAVPLILTSHNGEDWTQRSVSMISGDSAGVILNDVAYGNGKWVAVGYEYGNSEPRVFVSTDAITWTQKTVPGHLDRALHTVKYADGLWVAVAFEFNASTNMIYASADDGETWSAYDYTPVGNTTSGFYDIDYVNGKWYASGLNAAGEPHILSTATPTVSSSWAAETPPIASGMGIESMEFANNTWMAVGSDAPGNNMRLFKGTAAFSWTEKNAELATALSPDDVEGNLYTVAYGDDLWVAVGEDTDDVELILTSGDDGDTWTRRTISGLASNVTEHLEAVTHAGELWIAVGKGIETPAGDQAVLTSANGTAWEVHTLPVSDDAILTGVAADN